MTTTEVSTELVLTERHDGVLTITINRPGQKNAVSREVAVQLAAALDELDSDPTLSVGVLTGAGGTFSAGMDLKAFATGQTPNPARPWVRWAHPSRGAQAAHRSRRRMGAGRWFRDGAGLRPHRRSTGRQIRSPEVKRGLIAGEGGVIRLPQRIPYHVALTALLTGEPISAADAKQYGLVSELTASGAALAGAQQLAHRIAGNAPLALAKVKQVLRETQGLNDTEAFKHQSRTHTACWTPRTRTKARWRSPRNVHPSGAGADHQPK